MCFLIRYAIDSRHTMLFTYLLVATHANPYDCVMDLQIYQKCRSHLKILGARKLT